MDITPVFWTIIGQLEKNLGPKTFPDRDKSRILHNKSKRDPLESRARDIAKSIGQLRMFLIDNRQVYLDVNTLDDSMEDDVWEKIDNGANTYIRTCNALISKFKSDLKSNNPDLSELRSQHLKAVCEILETFLKSACDIYAEQKAIRVKKEVEYQKLSRLEVKARTQSESHESLEDRAAARAHLETNSINDISSDESDKELTSKTSTKPTNQVLNESDAESEELSPEEIQMLEKENEQLYEELLGVQDNVQQIENKVVKIAELQEIFTEKVLRQKEDIEHIAMDAVKTTENVKDGNEELRKAIQNQASIRVYILFFLLVMSFSLLFLDWYND